MLAFKRAQVIMKNGLISIIVPTHNRSKLLRDTLESCVMQSYQNIEVIVVDDGSDEDIKSVVDNFCAETILQNKLYYVRQNRQGGNAARNNGIAHAKGELIQFLDSDDLMHPRKLELQSRHLLANPCLGMTYCLTEIFKENPGDLGILWNVPRLFQWALSDLERFLLQDPVWDIAAPLWRSETIAEIGKWDENLVCWQDWEFHVRALTKGIQYDSHDIVLQYARQHDGPSTATINNFQQREDSCVYAGKLAYNSLVVSKMLTERNRYLMLWYFLCHLELMASLNSSEFKKMRSQLLACLDRIIIETRLQHVMIKSLRFFNNTSYKCFVIALRAMKGFFEKETIPSRPFHKTIPVLHLLEVPDVL